MTYEYVRSGREGHGTLGMGKAENHLDQRWTCIQILTKQTRQKCVHIRTSLGQASPCRASLHAGWRQAWRCLARRSSALHRTASKAKQSSGCPASCSQQRRQQAQPLRPRPLLSSPRPGRHCSIHKGIPASAGSPILRQGQQVAPAEQHGAAGGEAEAQHPPACSPGPTCSQLKQHLAASTSASASCPCCCRCRRPH